MSEAGPGTRILVKPFAWKVTPASSRRVGGSEGRRGRRRAQRVREWGARQARSRWTPGDGAGTDRRGVSFPRPEGLCPSLPYGARLRV